MGQDKTQKEKYVEEKVKFIYDVIQRQLEIQLDNVSFLDNKASSIIGLLSTLLAGISVLKPKAFSVNFLVTLGFLCIFSSVLLSIVAYWVRNYQIPPKPRAFLYEQIKEDYITTINQQSSNLVDAYEKNEAIIKKKVSFLKSSLVTLLVGLLFILVGHTIGGYFMCKDEANKPSIISIPPPKPSQEQTGQKAPSVPEPKRSQQQVLPATKRLVRDCDKDAGIIRLK
jgi:hypothetical protein